MLATTLADYPHLMYAIWTGVGLVVGLIAGAIWSRWQTRRDPYAGLTTEEITLLNAGRLRQQRERTVNKEIKQPGRSKEKTLS